MFALAGALFYLINDASSQPTCRLPKSDPEGVVYRHVCVATHDIPENSTIKDADYKVSEVYVERVPAGSIRPDVMLGKVATREIRKDQVITSDDVMLRNELQINHRVDGYLNIKLK